MDDDNNYSYMYVTLPLAWRLHILAYLRLCNYDKSHRASHSNCSGNLYLSQAVHKNTMLLQVHQMVHDAQTTITGLHCVSHSNYCNTGAKWWIEAMASLLNHHDRASLRDATGNDPEVTACVDGDTVGFVLHEHRAAQLQLVPRSSPSVVSVTVSLSSVCMSQQLMTWQMQCAWLESLQRRSLWQPPGAMTICPLYLRTVGCLVVS